MEKPSWAFKNVTYFNKINNNDKNYFIFSDFEHNWDFFQFLTNENKYYFCLNKNINSKYNFDIIYKTYQQKVKHLNSDNIHFILFFKEQENFIKELPILLNFVYDKEALSILNIEETLIKKFDTHQYDDAIKIINNTNKLFINETEINYLVNKNIIKRSIYKNDDFSSICFFGASVTEQKYSYVNYLVNNCKDLTIIKKGYSGCHINQVIWLVNDIISMSPKPKIFVLEWLTSVLKPSSDELKCYLDIICKKLLENNITPIFLYLYKNDINEYLEIVDYYEEVAINYNISSIFLYKVIKEIENIDISLILKDSCHTTYEGSNLYGLMIKNIINNLFLNNDLPAVRDSNKQLLINEFLYKKYNNIQVFLIEKLTNCENIDKIFFNEKTYYKIDKELLISFNNDTDNNNNDSNNKKLLLALNILHYKNNGYILINENKIQTWDKNCYYKRFGYINLNTFLKEKTLKIAMSQEQFDTSECKYDVDFPNEKYLWLSEIILSSL